MRATRGVVFAGAGVVGAAATATSAVSLFQLGQSCGIPGIWAAALPIALDVGAGVASLAWITETGAVRTWSRAVAVVALAGTVAGNGIQHAITQGLLPVTLMLVLAVGASIPAMLWATIHLGALLVQPERKARKVAEAKPKVATPELKSPVTSKPAPTAPPAPSEIESHRGQRQVIVEWVSSQDERPKAKEIQARFQVSRATAFRVLSDVNSA
jgi:hypothetical protein